MKHFQRVYFVVKAVKPKLLFKARYRNWNLKERFGAKRAATVGTSWGRFVDFVKALRREQVEADETSRCHRRSWYARQITMRSNATVVPSPSNRNRTFPSLNVANKNVIRFDQERLLPRHITADQWRLVKCAFPKRANCDLWIFPFGVDRDRTPR